MALVAWSGPRAAADELGSFVHEGIRFGASPAVAAERDFTIPKLYRDRVGPVTNADGAIRRVFYPLGAADLLLAMSLFTGPKTGPTEIAIVDLLPFGAPGEILAHRANRVAKHKHFRMKQTFFSQGASDVWQQTRYAGTGLLWELESAGARSIAIEYLDAEGNVVPAPLVSRAPTGLREFQALDAPAWVNARVRFFLDGRWRSVLYVHGDVQSHRWQPPAVLRRFLDDGIDALIQKAGLGLESDDPRYRDLLRLGLSRLHRDHGVVISEPDTLRAFERMGLRAEGLRAHRLADVRYGYTYDTDVSEPQSGLGLWSRRPLAAPAWQPNASSDGRPGRWMDRVRAPFSRLRALARDRYGDWRRQRGPIPGTRPGGRVTRGR
jgi:hypothetical protein